MNVVYNGSTSPLVNLTVQARLAIILMGVEHHNSVLDSSNNPFVELKYDISRLR